MGRRSSRNVGWIALAAVALLSTVCGAATLVDRARLREGPSKETRQLGWLEPATSVTLEGERNGWYAVRAPDGQAGFIWKEHLRFEAGEEAPMGATVVATTLATATSIPAAAPTPIAAPAPSPVPAPAPELRPSADRSDAAMIAELERLRTEISRLAAAQQELTQRMGRVREGTSSVPVPISSDGSAGAAVLFLGAGAFVGWVIGRFMGGRRERRTRIRL